MSSNRFHRAVPALALAVLLLAPDWAGAQADTPTTVSVRGGASGASQTLPAGQLEFGLRVPLRPNAENVLTVVAADELGRAATSEEVRITQLSLTEIVRAQVTAERLSTEEVRALVADGTINLSDPENYNVSRFVVALVVGGRPVEVAVPVIRYREEPLGVGESVSIGCAGPGQGITTTERTIVIPCGGGGGGGGQAVQLIPFEIAVPGVPAAPTIPGVILIEGRIKTLKEFFKVNLMLMNLSSLFTLTDIEATLEVPLGALTPVAPASAAIVMADLGPGEEATGQFIVRGDRIGTHQVTAHFVAKLTGAFLPEPVAISGQASTDLEVKGPPKMAVTLAHPDYVTAGEPYTLTVQIRNTDPELDALYASLALDVGADARLVDETTGDPLVTPVTRSLGDILRGESLVQSYRVLPLVTGPITSCVAGVTENIQLSVVFTRNGPSCAIGTFPAARDNPDGRPTVTTVPTHNTTNVAADPAIVALFSNEMIAQTITTGYPDATFKLLDEAGHVLGGTLQIATLFEGTAAVFRPTNGLAPDSTYTIVVESNIFDVDGRQLASGMISRFTTYSLAPPPDTTPPQVAMSLEPPVVAAAVPRGQLLPVLVEATDDGDVVRVDLYLGDRLIDTRRPNSVVSFRVETGDLLPGSSHTLRAIAHDRAGNRGTASFDFSIAPDLTPPTVTLSAPPSVSVGRALAFTVEATDDGSVRRIEVFVDQQTTPVYATTLSPGQGSLSTTGFAPGTHVLRAQATDGAGNVGSVEASFAVVADTTPPVATILTPMPGHRQAPAAPLAVTAAFSDDVGIASVGYFIGGEVAPRATTLPAVMISVADLPLGVHQLRLRVVDTSGNATEAAVLFELFEPPPDTTPPPTPVATLISATAPSGFTSTVVGLAGAVEANARVEISSLSSSSSAEAMATAAGAFSAQIEVAGGETLSIVAIDAAGNRSTSTSIVVPIPPRLVELIVSPGAVLLTRTATSRQLTVLGGYHTGVTSPLPAGVLRFVSLNTSVATVTANGNVLAQANGETTIRVTADGVPSVDVPVVVDIAALTGVTVEPNPLTLVGTAASRRIVVTAVYSDESTGPFTGPTTFSSSTPSVATVDSAGNVRAITFGTTSVTVSPAGFPAVVVPVIVEGREPTGIVVSPSSLALTSVGETVVLQVIVQYNDGTTSAAGAPGFVSSDESVVTVSPNGVVSAVGNGTATIQVTALSFTASVAVTVTLPELGEPPVITALGRPVAGEGDSLVILGHHFSAIPAENLVTVSGVAADVLTASANRLIVRVPRAAVTGPVQVEVAGQASNIVDVGVYARRARAVLASGPFDVNPASPGQVAALGSVTLDVREGDQVWLSGDPNLVADRQFGGLIGPSFIGTLTVTVDGVDYSFAPSATPIDLGTFVGAGEHEVSVRLQESGGRLQSRGLAIVSGPPATGAFAGERFLSGDGTPQHMVVRFRNLRRLDGTPIPDGSLVGVTAAQWWRVTDGGWNNGSAGGAIVNGVPSTNSASVRMLEVQDGEIAVVYSDEQVFAGFGTAPVAVISVLEANASGAYTANQPIAAAGVILGSLHSASVIPAQTSSLADGTERPIAVRVDSFRDVLGNPMPDGARVGLTAQPWYRRSDGGWNNGSPGGVILNGDPSPSNGHTRTFVVEQGAVEAIYSPTGIALPVGDVRTAVLAAVPVRADGVLLQDRPFAEGSVVLSSPGAVSVQATAVPGTLLANAGDNRSVVTVSGFTDSEGRPLPDGTLIGVTAVPWYRVSDGVWSNGSAGGTILSGTANAPNNSNFRLHAISGGQIAITYSSAGVWFAPRQTAAVVISLMPANAGGILGTRPFAAVPIGLSGISDATITPEVTSTLADGVDRPIRVTVTNIVDAFGTPVPDGTKVGLTASAWYRVSDGGWSNGSHGGRFVDGEAAGNLGPLRVYSVADGRIEATYSADTAPLLPFPSQATTVFSALVVNPANNHYLANLPIAAGAIALSSVNPGNITAAPTSLLADAQPRTSSIQITGLTDAQGQPLPDGARVGLTAAQWYRVADGGWSNGSVGGTIVGGTAANTGAFRVFEVMGGALTSTYSSEGQVTNSGETRTAVVSVIPVDALNRIVGTRPLLSVNVTLAGLGSADWVAPAATPPGSTVAVTLTNIRDALGNLVPDGTRIALTAATWWNVDGSWSNQSAGGTLTGGTTATNHGAFQVYTVTGGAITATFQAPASNEVTAVISAVSANLANQTVTTRPFTAFAIRATNQ